MHLHLELTCHRLHIYKNVRTLLPIAVSLFSYGNYDNDHINFAVVIIITVVVVVI